MIENNPEGHSDFSPEDHAREMMDELTTRMDEVTETINFIMELRRAVEKNVKEKFARQLGKSRSKWKVKSRKTNPDGTITSIYDTGAGLLQETQTEAGERTRLTLAEEDIIPFWKEE